MSPDIRASLNIDIDEEVWIELDDIYEALDKDDKIKIFWWIIEDVFEDVKERLIDWFED